jgi:hypothetical protein
MTIIAHCETPELSVLEQPPTSVYYHVGDAQMTIFTYDLYTVVSSSLMVNCGVPMMEFTTSVGFEIEVIFSFETCFENECMLTVYTEDLTLAGEYELQFVYYYSGMPSVYVTSEVFVVTVVNVCIPPPGCIDIVGCGVPPPTVYVPQVEIVVDYTITTEIVVDLPSWGCGTPGCSEEVVPVCVDCTINGLDIVVVVDNQI